jgi:prepilin signal peptidase PulO-like enzyme (type II secretory pathway)
MDPNVVLTILNIVMAGVFGAVIGSFTNVCIYRIPEHRTIVKGHSMCMTCGHELGALDLVPIFSWLCLGGKCRYCKTPISSRYIKIESLTALAYMLMAATHLNMFLDPMDTFKNILPFLALCAMFIMTNIVIVEMMIMKDTGSSMYRLSVALIIDLAVQIGAKSAYVATRGVDDVVSESILTMVSGVIWGALIGLTGVVLVVLLATKAKHLSKYFSDKKMRPFSTSDLFAIVLCASIGIVPAIVCAVGYLIARIVIGNGKNVRFLGIYMAASAAIGYFCYQAWVLFK